MYASKHRKETASMNTATEKQVAFTNKLRIERDLDDDGNEALKICRELWRREAFTKQAASGLIEVLLTQPKSGTVVLDTPAPEGMHRHPQDGAIFKVQRSPETGRLYAKQLVSQGDKWTFEYAPGKIRDFNESTKMSLEDAKEFGVLYGTCCVCGRTLTNEVSIERGIGPICGGRF